jgi:HB1/ASXL restriction endonuclease-like protein with HTH domain
MPATTEDRVRDRMERERAELTDKLTEARKAETGAIEDYRKADEECSRLADALIEREDNGESDEISKEQRDEVDAAHRAVMRALNGAITRSNAVRQTEKALALLDDPEEVARRIEQANELADLRATDRKVSGRDAAVAILLRNDGPMHYREITSQAVQSGLLTPKGKTPDATMNAMLAVAAKAGEVFTKVAPGVFGLIDADAARANLRGPAADAAENGGDAPEATEEPTEAPTEAPTEEPTEAPEATEEEETLTPAQKRARKAAATRKRNAAAKKKD